MSIESLQEELKQLRAALAELKEEVKRAKLENKYLRGHLTEALALLEEYEEREGVEP